MKDTKPAPSKPRFKTQWNQQYNGVYDSEQDASDVHTIPDMYVDIRTLLVKHAQGVPIPLGKTPEFHGDLEIPNHFDLSDPVDIANFISDLEERKKLIMDSMSQKDSGEQKTSPVSKKTGKNDDSNDDLTPSNKKPEKSAPKESEN